MTNCQRFKIATICRRRRTAVLSTLVGVAVALSIWLLHREAKWQASADAIKACGGSAHYVSLRDQFNRFRDPFRDAENQPWLTGTIVVFDTSDRTPRELFPHLGELPGMSSLNLSEMEFAPEDLAPLQEATDLRQLFLYDTGADDKSIACLRHMNKLEMLGLTGTEITDRAIAELANLPRLSYLAVGELPLTDASVEHLIRMSALRTLEVHSTKISAAGFERLRTALPNCNIKGQPAR